MNYLSTAVFELGKQSMCVSLSVNLNQKYGPKRISQIENRFCNI